MSWMSAKLTLYKLLAFNANPDWPSVESFTPTYLKVVDEIICRNVHG